MRLIGCAGHHTFLDPEQCHGCMFNTVVQYGRVQSSSFLPINHTQASRTHTHARTTQQNIMVR